MKSLERNGSQVWAARTCAGMDVWFGWFAAVLKLNKNGVLPCSLATTGERLLLRGRGAKAQTGHRKLAVTDEESPGYSFTVTGEVGVYLYVTPGSHFCVHYSRA